MRQNDTLFIVLGAFYLVVGMLLGIGMGIRQDFEFAPLHAHINLVGFAGHCVFGLVYKAWPNLKQGAMAAVQFWLYVLGAPLLLVGIAMSIKANNISVAIVGSILVLLGALLFLVITARGLLRLDADPDQSIVTRVRCGLRLLRPWHSPSIVPGWRRLDPCRHFTNRPTVHFIYRRFCACL